MTHSSSRVGLLCFGAYLALYLGFVILNAFFPDVMKSTPIAGVNLAVLYGFGLIIAAIVMALLYGLLPQAELPAETNVHKPS